MYNSATSSEQTQAVDVGLLAGAEFAINDNLMIGGGVDYNHNIMNNRNNFVSVYNLQPDDTKALEEIDYYTVKINAKLTF
jgi:opacity protein-like surface antigen